MEPAEKGDIMPVFPQPQGHHLAQVNIALAMDDMDSPLLKDFVGALDGVNRLADRAPGFVWRLQTEDGDATGIDVGDDPRLLVNLSVWETPAALSHFVWQTVHKRVFAKRAKWFVAPKQVNVAMWWVPAGHLPTVAEAMERLQTLRRDGPSETAFGWESLPETLRPPAPEAPAAAGNG